jgi:hypothetical protein
MTRAADIAGLSGLPRRIEQASDAFFGRSGKLMAMSQIEAGVEIRAAGSAALGDRADRVHGLQQSPRSFRLGVESA